jgi:hypothetical protein
MVVSFGLKPLFYRSFEPRWITPAGWLRRQLEIQARGLDGCLDLIWPDVRDGPRREIELIPYVGSTLRMVEFLLTD